MKIVINISVVLISLLAGLLMAETILRLVSPQLRIMKAGILEYDELKGYRLKKNYKDVHDYGLIHTNEFGYRDNSINMNADLVILAVGDSHTYGAGVDQNETYPAILEKKISKKLSKKIEVINAGVFAYGWLEEYQVIKELIEKHGIDVVILQTSWNDINDNAMGIPKYAIDKSGNLIRYHGKKRIGGYGKFGMKTKKISDFELYLLKHSHLAAIIIGNWAKFKYAINKKKIDKGIDQYKWEKSERVLKKIKGLVDSKSVSILVVIHPGDRPDKLERREKMVQQVVFMLEKHEIPYVNLFEKIKEVNDAEKLYIDNDEHFNKNGYMWMVEEIQEEVLENVRQ